MKMEPWSYFYLLKFIHYFRDIHITSQITRLLLQIYMIATIAQQSHLEAYYTKINVECTYEHYIYCDVIEVNFARECKAKSETIGRYCSIGRRVWLGRAAQQISFAAQCCANTTLLGLFYAKSQDFA